MASYKKIPRQEELVIEHLEAGETRAETKLFLEKMTHGKSGKIIGILGIIGSLYFGERYMERHIPGLQRAYDNFVNTIETTIEFAPEMIGIKHEDYDTVPTIIDLDKDNETFSEQQRRDLEKFLYNQYKPKLK